MNFKQISFFFFGLFLTSLIITSCTNEDIPKREVEDDKGLEFTYRNTNYSISEYSGDFHNFWESSFDYYSMNVLCACDCNAFLTVQEAINTYEYLLPENIPVNDWNYNCQELDNMWGSCALTTQERKQTLLSLIEPNEFISIEENTLIHALINDIVANGLDTDFDLHRQTWHNLETTSAVNNGTSAMMIEITASAMQEFPAIVGGDDDDDDIQAWINKALGAAFGAYWGAMGDVLGNDGSPSDDFFEDMAWGALGGAISAG